MYDALFRPLALRHLTLRNRVMSTAHAPGYAVDGLPGERYQLYHEEKAKGGLALTMFGGSSSVAPDSPLVFSQISVADDRVVPLFRQMAGRVHRHGAALVCQISHLGRRGRWDSYHWLPLVAPSPVREPLHRSFPKEMEDWDFDRVIAAYGAAARRCKEGGLDGVEVIAVAHHLIDSFLTPLVNRRTDAHGGSLENRMRFGLDVLREVRRQVGPDYLVGLRMSGDELVEGGLSAEDCVEIAVGFAQSGLIDFLNVYHGQSDKFEGLALMLPGMTFPPAPFLYLASAIKARIDLPVFHASAIHDVESAARAIEDGHVDMVGMTRAHIADPHLVRKLMEARPDDIRQCVGANYCVDRISLGRDALCIQNAATGREATMPHVVARAPQPRKVVVAGAGPAGLEAARVAAERGHAVVLFESADRTGGQINIAMRAPWRTNLSGIARWLDRQVRKLGVDLRLQTPAMPESVLAECPDVVIVATGGSPNKGSIGGVALAVSTWEVLTGAVEPGETVLVYDDNGQHQGPGCAEYLAERGALVELVTPDRMAAEEMGGSNQPIHLRQLYSRGVVLTPNLRLTRIRREGNRLVAVLRNEYSHAEEERAVDQIVCEHGTLPVDELYFALKPLSRNGGAVDHEALIAGRPQSLVRHPAGAFQLFRVGDAVASRNIHAAIYDSLRLVKDI